jgi:PAS domain S-box-containing protein
MTKKNQFRILFVEDDPSDVDLAVLELRKEKLKFEYTTVCTRNDLLEAIKKFIPDLIISDYMMPAFNGLQALKTTRVIAPDIPFILYTGSVNEETAVECLKAGAQDYVIKEHSTRLPFAVKEVMEQVRINKEKKASELLLKENEEKLQSVFRAAPVGIGLMANRKFIEVNDFFCNMTGYTRSELVGESSEILFLDDEESLNAGNEKYKQITEKSSGTVETKCKHKDGTTFPVLLSLAPLDANDVLKGVTFTVLDVTESKKNEEALKKSQQLFQTLSEVSPVGVFRTLPDGYTTYVNPKWLEISGLSSEEAMGFGWLKAVHPDDRAQINQQWQSDVQLKKTSNAEYRFLRSDGSIIWVIGNAVPEWHNDIIAGYIGTITDITERKHAEEAIAGSESKYRHLVTHSPDGIFIIDLSGNFLSVNKAICENLKYTEEELFTMNIWDIVPDQFHSIHKQRLMAIVNGESTSDNAEYEVRGKDGILRSVEIMSSPHYKGGVVIGFQSIARDITERKRSEKALRESEEKYRGIFENVQDLFYETSFDGTILEVSPSIKLLSKGQYTREDLLGKSIFDYYSDPVERVNLLSQIVKKGYISDFEFTLKNKDGTKIPCSLSSKVLTDAFGQPFKLIGSVRDITDRKNASEALKLAKEKAEASDKLKTEFLNNISHEVRTPLNGILGFAEIMAIQDLSEEDKKESTALLFESSNRLLNTITNYMDISLITSGSLSITRKDFKPSFILRRIFSNFESACKIRNLELFLDIPEQSEDILIYSDPEICQKIISHFVDNSIKFTLNGSIRFGFSLIEDQLEYYVKDTGIGISLESFDTIFDQFSKDKRSQLYVSEGSGLGLSIARGLAEAIGGKVKFESESGIGSCFYLSIPVNSTNIYSAPETQEDGIRKLLSGSLILIAEDDETNYYYLNALLTRETGANILHASTGREAINLYKANPDIALILMDMKMPDIDGFEATRQIKLLNRNVNIIAITAYAMSGDEERIISAGCDGYLSKPLNKRMLLEKIEEFISIR